MTSLDGAGVWLAVTGIASGLILGSFVNTLADRLPRGQSLVRPRSHCPACQRTLSWWELIPVLGYLLLRGRCRSCGQSLSPRLPLVELGLGIGGGLIALKLGPTPAGGVLLLLVSVLTALGLIDLERGMLPDKLTWPLLAGGLAWSWSQGPGLSWSALGVVVCGGLVWLTGAGYLLLRKRPGLGGGDPKLAAALGAWLGPSIGLICLALGAGMGALYGLTMIALGRAGLRSALPLGPFLAFSGILWALLRWPLV